MSLYKYKACNAQGKIIKDVIEADSERDVHQKLSELELRCISCSEFTGKQKEKKASQATITKGSAGIKRYSKDLPDFCAQMSTVLGTGVSVGEALRIIYETAGKKSLRTIAIALAEEVEEGKSLAVAMSGQTPPFPPLLMYMIESGEQDDTLAPVMSQMAHYYERQIKWRRKLRGSLTYPVTVTIITLIAVMFMLAFILPSFASMFQSVALPLPTKALFSISQFLSSFWLWFVVVLFVVILLCRIFFRKSSAKYVLDRWKLWFPGSGKLMRTMCTAEFAAIFSNLYQSGKSIVDCVKIASSEMQNDYVAEQLKLAAERLENGAVLSECLKEIDVFDPLFCRMICIEEHDENLASILVSLENSFRDAVDCALGRLSSWLEPVLITVLAIIIGFIVVSIILPVFTVYGQLS